MNKKNAKIECGDTVEFLTGNNQGFRCIVVAELADAFEVEFNEEFFVVPAAELKLTNKAN